MLKDYLKSFKEGKFDSLTDAIQDFVSDLTNEADDELAEIIENVESGKYSNEEIAEQLRELKSMIY